jgi:hypothetical protein
MNKIITLSEAAFKSKAAEAVSKQPIRKEILFNEIEIVDDQTIRYEGKLIGISKRAFQDIHETLQIPKAFMKRFESSFGPEGKRSLINRIKEAQTLQKNQEVTLIVNPADRRIERVLRKGKGIISNDGFIDFTTRYIDQYNLEVTDFHVGDNGSININALSPRGMANVPGMEREMFKTGVSFSNGPQSGTIVSPYLHRLVCSNGMVARGFEETYQLSSLDPAKVEEFNEQMIRLSSNSFTPAGLIDRIESAHRVPASLAEMQKAAGLIMSNSKIEYGELQKFVPIESTQKAFERYGANVSKMTRFQLQNATTGTSVWNLINGMTNFASNYGGKDINDYSRSNLMVHAGGLLTKKTYDTENLIFSPFSNKLELEHEQPNTGDRW